MRMKWHQEIRWLLATWMVHLALKLVAREASIETLEGFISAIHGLLHNDQKYDTVKMKRYQDEATWARGRNR